MSTTAVCLTNLAGV